MVKQIARLESQLQPFFGRIGLRDILANEERQAIVEAASDRISFAAGDDLVVEGDRPTRSLLVTEGLTSRYRLRPNGERQLMAIHLPGDFVDLHSFLLKEMDHSVGALTDCSVVAFPHERLVALTERFPHLTRLLWLLTLVDGASHREWLVGLGLLSATQRAAHLLCEVYVRLEAVDLAGDHRFSFPVTQTSFADAVGVSSVHINRVIQELRQDGLITWEGGLVTIHDWDGLVNAGEFDPRYLHLVKEQR